MSWALERLPTSEQVMEWEAHCNVVEEPQAVFLCQYELALSTGKIVMDALKTHPLCIVSNIVHRDPLYVHPEAAGSRPDSSPNAP